MEDNANDPLSLDIDNVAFVKGAPSTLAISPLYKSAGLHPSSYSLDVNEGIKSNVPTQQTTQNTIPTIVEFVFIIGLVYYWFSLLLKKSYTLQCKYAIPCLHYTFINSVHSFDCKSDAKIAYSHEKHVLIIQNSVSFWQNVP